MFSLMKKLLSSTILMCISMYSIADTQTFKIVKNDPNEYAEEFFNIKTNKGNLGIYMNLSEKHTHLISSLKKGDCLSLTVNGKFEKNEDGYFIESVQNAKKVRCTK